MARLLADENFPWPVVEALRAYTHDVVTMADLGCAGQRVSDAEVLAMARAEQRAVLTLNRRDFFRLHQAHPDHEGIIACTFDPDFAGQARRIHTALSVGGELRAVLLRVNRPSI